MTGVQTILENNRRWAAETETGNPGFFERLAQGQKPQYLWIGCSDSRVPATHATGLQPGDLFVHRNIANVVAPDDPNALAVVQYAVEALKVPHIIVCGHYNCGGVNAALTGKAEGGLADWLQPVSDLAAEHKAELEKLVTDQERWDRLCELNVLRQARNLGSTPFVRNAWGRGQKLEIHSWIFRLIDGHLQALAEPISGPQ